MKKRILSLALVVVMVALVAAGSMAYFTDKSEVKTNTFTVGNVQLGITELMWDADQKKYVAYENQTLVPNKDGSAPAYGNKVVDTYNNGAADAYIRTFVTCPADLWDELGYGFNKGTSSSGVIAADVEVNGVITQHKLDKWNTVIGPVNIGTTEKPENVYIFVCENYDAVAPGASVRSLTKIWINATGAATLNTEALTTFNVKVVSEAIQADGLTYEAAMQELTGGNTTEALKAHAVSLFTAAN